MRFDLYNMTDYDGVHKNLIVPDATRSVIKISTRLLLNCNKVIKFDLHANNYYVIKNRYDLISRNIQNTVDTQFLYDILHSNNDENLCYLAFPAEPIVIAGKTTMMSLCNCRIIKFPLGSLTPDDLRIIIKHILNMMEIDDK